MLAVLIVLAGLAAGGWYAWQAWGTDSGTTRLRTAPPTCVPTTPPPSAPPRLAAPVRVLNGSLRPGLAATAARRLHRRFGVHVVRVGNAAAFQRGDSVLRYPPGLAEAAGRLQAMLVPAPRLVSAATGAKLEIDLGTRFRRVATAAEYRAAVAAASPTASPSPSPTTAASSPGCP